MIRLSGRWFAITLIASLAINLFLAGVIVSSLFFHRHGPHERFGRGYPHHAARQALNDEARKQVDAIWREARPDLRTRIREVRRARRDVRQRLRADTLDQKALDEALAALRARSLEAQTAIHRTISKVAGTLSAEDRRDYFQRYRKRYRRYPRRQRE